MSTRDTVRQASLGRVRPGLVGAGKASCGKATRGEAGSAKAGSLKCAEPDARPAGEDHGRAGGVRPGEFRFREARVGTAGAVRHVAARIGKAGSGRPG